MCANRPSWQIIATDIVILAVLCTSSLACGRDVSVARSTTATEPLLLKEVDVSVPRFRLSPDGRSLAISVASEAQDGNTQTSLWHVDVATGTATPWATLPFSAGTGAWSADAAWYVAEVYHIDREAERFDLRRLYLVEKGSSKADSWVDIRPKYDLLEYVAWIVSRPPPLKDGPEWTVAMRVEHKPPNEGVGQRVLTFWAVRFADVPGMTYIGEIEPCLAVHACSDPRGLIASIRSTRTDRDLVSVTIENEKLIQRPVGKIPGLAFATSSASCSRGYLAAPGDVMMHEEWGDVWLVNLDTGEAEVLAKSVGAWQVKFSHDGLRLACYCTENRDVPDGPYHLSVVEVASGRVSKLASVPRRGRILGWSSDDSEIIMAIGDEGVVAISADPEKPLHVRTLVTVSFLGQIERESQEDR